VFKCEKGKRRTKKKTLWLRLSGLTFEELLGVYNVSADLAITIFTVNVFAMSEILVLGLRPSSGILETIKHDVSETGSASVFK
jgi:hypothetical protein